MNWIENLKENIDRAQIWSREMVLARNEFLTTKGKVNTNIYYIEDGSLRIFFDDGYEEQVIRLGYRGDFIGALDSYLTEMPTDFNIQAIKKSRLLVLQKAVFTEFIGRSAENLGLWQKIMEGLIYQQLEREKDLLTQSPRRRYERVLSRSPHLFQEIPAKHIASYLRMSPETLSRLKKQEERGTADGKRPH